MEKNGKLGKKSDYLKFETIDALQVKPAHTETCWQIPPKLGTGSINRLSFNNGIQLYIHDYKTLDAFRGEKKWACIWFQIQFFRKYKFEPGIF